MSEVDRDWFAFSPSTGEGSNGDYWNYTRDWKPKQAPRTRRERATGEKRMQELAEMAKLWNEFVELIQAGNNISRGDACVAIGAHLNMGHNNVEKAMRRNNRELYERLPSHKGRHLRRERG